MTEARPPIVIIAEAGVNHNGDMGLPLVKIPSGGTTNLPYLRRVAAKGRPVILSTGMTTLDEVRDGVNVPTVNAGDRQKGRERADSVFDCAPDAESVASAIRHARSPQAAGIVKETRNPYEKQGTSRHIADRLKLGIEPGPKPFFDVEYRLPEAKEQRS